jgi:hypothetical protein
MCKVNRYTLLITHHTLPNLVQICFTEAVVVESVS